MKYAPPESDPETRLLSLITVDKQLSLPPLFKSLCAQLHDLPEVTLPLVAMAEIERAVTEVTVTDIRMMSHVNTEGRQNEGIHKEFFIVFDCAVFRLSCFSTLFFTFRFKSALEIKLYWWWWWHHSHATLWGESKRVNKWRDEWCDDSQMPAWEVIHDKRRNRTTPQILSMQRTCDKSHKNNPYSFHTSRTELLK